MPSILRLDLFQQRGAPIQQEGRYLLVCQAGGKGLAFPLAPTMQIGSDGHPATLLKRLFLFRSIRYMGQEAEVVLSFGARGARTEKHVRIAAGVHHDLCRKVLTPRLAFTADASAAASFHDGTCGQNIQADAHAFLFQQFIQRQLKNRG